MKKSDYKDIEEILSNKAARLEKRVGYSGAVRSADLDGSVNEDRHVRPHSPALQIAGAFLAAVIVGGGTFGALKYMEYKGAQIAANQGGPSEPAGYTDAAEKSEYDQASPAAERADGFGEVRFINYADDFSKFMLSSRIFADAELPIENGYQSVYKVSSEEADKLGFDVFIYADRVSTHYGGICVLDKEGGLVMNFEPAMLMSPPTCLLYAGETPSGHQTFFFTAVQELSGPAWDWTNLYACDLVTGQITEIGSTGPNAYGSNAMYTTGSLSYVESTGEILYNVYGKTYGTVIGQELTADNVIHNDVIVWDGEKYALRDLPDYGQSGTGSQTVPAETTEPDDQTTAPYDPALETAEVYDPTGWLIIKAGEKEYKPRLIIKREYKDGELTETGYESGDGYDPIFEYMSGDDLSAFSAVRRGMRVCSVTVDHNHKFDTLEEAFEYLREVTANNKHVSALAIVVTWDKNALHEDDVDRNEYLFYTRFQYNNSKNEPAPKNESLTLAGDGNTYQLLPSSKSEDGGKSFTYFSTQSQMIRLDDPRGAAITMAANEFDIIKLTVNGHTFDNPADAMKQVTMQYGISEVIIETTRDYDDKVIYTYEFEIMYDHTPDVPDDTTAPGPDVDLSLDQLPQAFREWLLTKLQPKMTFEDLCQTVWNIEAGGYQIKNDIRAAQYQQIEYGEDGTFMRYGNEGYDLTCFVENDDAETVREARLILRPGFSGFELPYGLSIDTTPVGALERLGFNAEQIAALEGKSEEEDGFTVSYYTTSVSFTYGFIEDGYSVSMGIEISDGSDDQVYIEIEKL